MQMNNQQMLGANTDKLLATNKVLRNTYLLLGLTFIFSAITAGVSVATNFSFPPGFMGLIVMLVGMYGLMFLTVSLRNSPAGIAAIFAFTGFMGFTLGPILNVYLTSFANGGQLIMTALGATGVIFFALSGYVLTTRKNFSYLGGFLFVGILVAFLAGIGATVFNIPGLFLAVSAAFVLLSSGLILFHTSQIIHGGETNYIMATIGLYIALFNLFINLLTILSALAGNRN